MFNWGVFLFVSCGLPCTMPHKMEKWLPMWCMSLLIIQYAFCFRLAIAGKHSDYIVSTINRFIYLSPPWNMHHMHFQMSLTIVLQFNRDLYAVSSQVPIQFCWHRKVNDPVRNIQKVVYVSWISKCRKFRKEDSWKWNLQSIRMGLRTYSWSTCFGGCYDCQLMVWFADREFILVPPLDSIPFKGRSWNDNR